MSVTTNDIAKICQVSRTTVLRALNNQGRISEETKERILKTAKELGYRPDLLARGLVKGRTMYIGVGVFDVKNQYFAQMLSAIETEAQKQGYSVNITLHDKNKTKEIELIRKLADYHMDGLILSPVNEGEEFAHFLKNLGIPLVIIGNKVSDTLPFVGIQEKEAAKEAVEKIIKTGYEEVIFVCPPLGGIDEGNIFTHRERLAGFCDVIAANTKISSQILSNYDYIEEAKKIVKDSGKKTAFFCSGDIFALEIMKELKKIGMKTPRDYGIMGFDDIEFLNYITPRLSTIYNSVEEVSRTAVKLLIRQMQGESVSMNYFENYHIIDGETL